jgi:hypothetical protein
MQEEAGTGRSGKADMGARTGEFQRPYSSLPFG